jgi:hypothetical protein
MEDSERAGFENLSDGVNVRKYCSGRNGCGECTTDYAVIFHILTAGIMVESTGSVGASIQR